MVSRESLVPMERIERAIFLIRGQKVMLDADLAELYGVLTKVLNQAVKRNKERFPVDFMFQLTKEEKMRWSQIVTTSKGSSFLQLYPMLLLNMGQLCWLLF